jgi:hypothetical protein
MGLQRSLNLSLDDPRVQKIQELGTKKFRGEASEDEKDELLQLIKELPEAQGASSVTMIPWLNGGLLLPWTPKN